GLAHRQHRKQLGTGVLYHCRGGGFAVHRAHAAGDRGPSFTWDRDGAGSGPLTHREFTAYGPSHWAVLAVFAMGAVLLVWAGRRQTDAQARVFGRILGALTAVIYAAVLIYSLIPPSIMW